ncbi:MAG: hypothetical protein Q8M77_04500 [Hydrogenophaga sp.]|nr:hypothetical protein [Hydrogenophaga sp.]
MKYLIRKNVLMGVMILVPALYIANTARLNYQGYCVSERKYLSDEEKIRVAAASILAQYPPAVILRKIRDGAIEQYTPPEQPIYYRNIDEFIALNAGCCKIIPKFSSDDRLPNLLERGTGTIYGIADITYQVRYLDNSELMQVTQARTRLPVSNCGLPKRWWNSIETSAFSVLIKFLKGE